MRILKTVAMAFGAVLLVAGPARAGETIRCESRNHRYHYCRADTDNHVTLQHQRSSIHCRQWVNWGYDRHGVWVDRGCAADFRVGEDSGSGAAIAAGAAVAGVAIAAVIAANRDRQKSEVPSWAVGTFSGYDELERTDLDITILPGGSVNGTAGDQRFTGVLSDKRLELGHYRFHIDRSGNGFVATDETNSNHRVVFRLSGGGYGGGYK